MFLSNLITASTGSCSGQIDRLKEEIENADAIVIGAGAGMSASAGFAYDGERFERNFADFRKKYGFTDMYSGGFYPYRSLEEYWAWWSKPVSYTHLHELRGVPLSGRLSARVAALSRRAGLDGALLHGRFRRTKRRQRHGVPRAVRPRAQARAPYPALRRALLHAVSYTHLIPQTSLARRARSASALFFAERGEGKRQGSVSDFPVQMPLSVALDAVVYNGEGMRVRLGHRLSLIHI